MIRLGVGQVREQASLAARAARAAALTRSRRTHPLADGRLAVRGVHAAFEVLRDRFGVPHVFASNAEDACFGQGFVHAQDRLFQMDVARRAAQGRIAELAGPRAVEGDRFARRLGFADIAARDLACCPEQSRALLFAYVRGVNEGVRTLPALPPEYALLGVAPEPWHPEHSMLLGRFVLFAFASNWDTELLRERLLDALGPKRAAAVDPVYSEAAHTVRGVPHAPEAADRLLRAYEAAIEAGLPAGAASNAFVLAAGRTTTGAPLLVSDPHLNVSLPGLLHVSHVSGGEFDVIGAGVAGIPLVAMGHNGALAWGITAGLADVSDCYIETVDPEQPTRYLGPDGWITGRTRIERIAVRGAPAVEEHVLETRHGPVVGPALGGERRAVALRSTALEPGDQLTPVLDLCRARSAEAFDEAVSRRPGTTFNYVYASREGAIGYRMSGSEPRRAHGEGLLPQDGAASPGPPAARPPEEMPHAADPPSGVLVSANQAPGSEHELGEEWCEPWRAERIAALLAERERHTVASLQAVQCDRMSEALLRLRDMLERADALPHEVVSMVRGWDGQARAESAAAAFMETVYGELAEALATRAAGPLASVVLGEPLTAYTGSSFGYRLQGRMLAALETAAPPWCDDADDRDRLLRTAAARAASRLRDRLGPRPEAWRWGDLHRLRLEHPLGQAPVLGHFFSRGPYACGGDSNTVVQAGYGVGRGPDPAGVMPGYRQVIDLALPDRSVFQLPTGNSGIPGHPRYDDCTEEFLADRYRPLLYSRAAVERHLEHRLVLEPA